MGKPKIKTIGVLTSGGDAPAMNAAVRAVVRIWRRKRTERQRYQERVQRSAERRNHRYEP